MIFQFGSLLATARGIQAQKKTATIAEALREAQTLLEAGLSFDETTKALRKYLSANSQSADGTYIYRWPRAVYEDRFVYEASDDSGTDRLFQASYTIDDQGAVAVGTPFEVRAQVLYVPVDQALAEAEKPLHEAFIGILREAAIKADGTALIRIIDPGVGSSGFYSAEVLQEAVADGLFPAGLQMFGNHMTQKERDERPEGDVWNLVGQTTEAGHWMDDGPVGPGVYALTRFMENHLPFIRSVAESVGLSIDARGELIWGEHDGREMPIIKKLMEIKSIDVVTRAGRGGQIVSLQEAARAQSKPAPVPAPQPNPLHKSDPLKESAHIMTPEEAQKLADEAAAKAGTVARESAITNYRAASSVAIESLSGLNLPEAARTRVMEAQLADLPLKDGALDKEAFAARVKEAAQAEALYAKEAYGYGDGKVNLPPTEAAKLAESEKPADPGLQSIFARLGI